jgi:tetratricopeptide (TPR) repeat protein
VVAHAQLDRGAIDLLLADGHYLRAERPVRTAAQNNPNDAHALSNLSILDWSFGRLDEAVRDAERAVAAAPSSAEAHAHLADALGSKLIASNAGTMEKISLAHRFRKEIDRTLELDANEVDALEDLAQFYWHAPGLVGGDKSKAKQTADRLAKLSPARAAAARADFAGDETVASRREQAVVAVWREAVAAQPNEYACRAGLAEAYLNAETDPNHLGGAEAEAKRAQAIDPGRVEAYKVLAAVDAHAGRWSELEQVLKQAQASVPDDRSPEYMAARTILTDNAIARMPLAEQLLRDYLGQPTEGQEPNQAAAHWRLGLVLEREGRKADAVRELQAAVSQDGTLDAAKKDLKRLS